MFTRRGLLALSAAGLLRSTVGASAQEWPQRPIRIVVPFEPGGGADIIGRIVAQSLQEKLGQPVVIENRPGAAGTLGNEAVARADKDGFKTLVSQLYVPDDKFIETDVQFGVTRHLIGNYIRHENEKAPAPDVKGAWYSLEHSFVMEAGRTKLPRPPITGKASGERPKIPHLA